MNCAASDKFPCDVTTTRAFIAALVITVTAVYYILRTRIQQDNPDDANFGMQAGINRFTQIIQNPQLKTPGVRGLMLMVIAKVLQLLWCKFCYLLPGRS